MKRQPATEPIEYPRFWAWLAFLFVAGVPWYLPAGSVHPVIWGVPYWVWISVGLSLVFCASVRWGCLHLWRGAADRDADDRGAGEAAE